MKLTPLIAQYVAFRQGLGEDFTSHARLLQGFARAVGEQRDITKVTPAQVTSFLAGDGPLTRYWHRKYGILRGFYRYAISRGYLSASPLPTTVPKEPERFVPHIYSMGELRRLLDGTASYQKQRILLEPHTFRAILLLLYGAGLRISEALSLTLADVDLHEAVIVIRDTKFYKTRLVPLGPELNQAMAQYARRRRADGHLQNHDAFFFVAKTGARVSIPLLQRAFRRLRSRSGVCRTDGARYQPRLHDLRHAFAVHRLTTWYQEGKDVQRLLPLLATYMGHVDMASTQVYLTMTPELLREAGQRFAKYALEEDCHD